MRTVRFDSREHYRTKVFPSPFHGKQAGLNVMKVWSRWYDYLSVPEYSCADMEYFAAHGQGTRVHHCMFIMHV